MPQLLNSTRKISRRSFLAATGAAAAWAMTGCKSMPGTDVSSLPRKSAMYKSLFGTLPNGQKVYQYTLTNSNGMIVQLITYGARLQRIQSADRSGNQGDVILGFDNLASYATKHAMDPYFGATIGRYANRIANGTFSLNGVTYHLPINDSPYPNTLHGGPHAWDQQVWQATEVTELGAPGVRFNLFSPAMQNGFPGDVEVAATYTLNEQNEIHVHFRANADAPTVINMCNHAYFNLDKPGTQVLDHVLTIHADHYTPVNNVLIPTGKIAPVAGTPYDFRKPVALSSRLKPAYTGNSKIAFDAVPYGYDMNWCLNNQDETKLAFAARIQEPKTGRVLDCYTTQPGIQVYTGNFLNGSIKGIGGHYPYHGAITLETQHYPNSPNQSNFPSTVLNPGEIYFQRTVYKFSTM
ncbi:MAG: galactose mutarotase [Planctomycetia bacterium]|nr:galactose mutarotase [Planctomycetia bacterium]